MKHLTFRKLLTTVLALMLVLVIPVNAETLYAVVASNSMPVYADAGMAWRIGSLPQMTKVEVLSGSGETAYISYNGNTGYAPVSQMISVTCKGVAFNTNSYVFQYPTTSSRWIAVSVGTKVNLLAVNGQWAMVEKSGVIAFTNKDHLSEQNVPEVTPQPEQNDPVIVEKFQAIVVTSGMPVYEKNSEKSVCLGNLPAGTVLNVGAYNSQWAYVELNGHYGFASIGSLQRVTTPEPTPQPSQTWDRTTIESLQNAGYSTEKVIYLFLTGAMKLNTAVACGILANIEKECSFRITNASSDGGYGIVQWTGVRNTRLKNWCKDNGLDYSTLTGQLWYLKYELENHHPKTLRYLQGVKNTSAGAYDAAYYFCNNFEIPANRAKRSVERGNLAKEKYWPRYTD